MTAAPTRPDEAAVDERARARDEHLLVMEDATVRFGDVIGIRDISLTVAPGTILGLIGPSGAGKTTTIRVLTGSLLPSSGRVRVLGEDPRRFHRRTRERIGYMPQQFTLYPDLTAGENVDFVASLFGLLFFRRRRRVKEVLEIVDLWDARGRRAGNLSGGQQRRLELASALVHEPELLFLDEPTAGIDPLLRARIWDELHRLKSAGRTLLVTTQYVNEAEECDLVALIAEGRLAALAEPEELRRQATGGDIIEIETSRAFEGSALINLPEVRSVNQISPRSFRVVVHDAGVATPSVVAAIAAEGGEVVTAREYRLTFDEVFAELVERNRQGGEGGEDAVPIAATAAAAEIRADPGSAIATDAADRAALGVRPADADADEEITTERSAKAEPPAGAGGTLESGESGGERVRARDDRGGPVHAGDDLDGPTPLGDDVDRPTSAGDDRDKPTLDDDRQIPSDDHRDRPSGDHDQPAR